jgi:two-component system sensor histidine kinase KdpD
MGLAIAKGIVEAHNGRIWIESATDGQGTRVVFLLPIGDEEKSVSSVA